MAVLVRFTSGLALCLLLLFGADFEIQPFFPLSSAAADQSEVFISKQDDTVLHVSIRSYTVVEVNPIQHGEVVVYPTATIEHTIYDNIIKVTHCFRI